MTLIIILTIVCMVTYTIEIMFGLAGTILMVMFMSLLIDTKTLVIYSILPQILVGTIGLYRSPRNIEAKILFGMLIFASIGAVFGLVLFYQFSVHVFHTLLASTITIFGTYLVFFPGRLKLNQPTKRVLDTLGGASQALFGISGPIAMTRLMGTFDEKLLIRNYALAFFLSMNIFRTGGYILNNTITPEILEMMLYSAPVLAIVLWNTNHFHFHVNEKLFKTVVSWMILLGGISLFFTGP
jgi:uncharacterized membrane protein YfcA